MNLLKLQNKKIIIVLQVMQCIFLFGLLKRKNQRWDKIHKDKIFYICEECENLKLFFVLS